MQKSFCCVLLLLMGLMAFAQSYPPGKVFRITSTHSMFPDSLRNTQPRVYNGTTYNAAEHYRDSTVFIFVPSYFNKKKPVHLVFWFHGWNNNIDSALSQFQLLQQFYDAHRNAIFIFPEGPKNAPDSYGGKLEQEGTLQQLVVEIESLLQKEKITAWRPTKKQANKMATITLAGHSGAYRVIGKLLSYSNAYQSVLLFDGLYGEIDAYLNYAQSPSAFINIYTDNGGTKQNSLDFLKKLDSLGIAYLHKEETQLTTEDVKVNRIIFLHSTKAHNDVITSNHNFERFLKKE